MVGLIACQQLNQMLVQIKQEMVVLHWQLMRLLREQVYGQLRAVLIRHQVSLVVRPIVQLHLLQQFLEHIF
ncbi:hypothetical protein D3C72_2452460 [compost metagenome]